MITENNLKKICYYILKNKTITTNKLIELGLTNDDINKLTKENILRKTKENEYALISVDILYQHAESIRLENRCLSYYCNEYIYELNPQHKENNIRFLAFCVKKENYELAFKILDSLYRYEDISKYNDLYLYVISTMTNVPERYKDKIKYITKEYLLNLFNSDEEEKKLIYRIIDGKYVSTIFALNEKGKYNLNICEDTLWRIISAAADKDKENNTILIEYIKEERYYDIKRLLTDKTTINKQIELCILELVENIINIIKFNKMPIKTKENSSNLHEAIFAHDFELAHKYNIEYLEKYNITKANPLTMLIDLINELIKENKQLQMSELEEIAYFIKAVSMSFEEAQTNYNLSEEDIIMIKLIYIRDCYIESMYFLGDKRLKEIEKIKNKTPRVQAFINELKINKTFYKDRLEFKTKKRKI